MDLAKEISLMLIKFKNNSLAEIRKGTIAALKHYDKDEADHIFFLIAEFHLNIIKSSYLFNQERALSESEILHFEKAALRLNKGEPIQYILGECEFLDCKIRVNPSVLIPRPETEELVDLILKENNKQHISLLDVGTGSGCIPISLKKSRPLWDVSAIDVSEEALLTARQNAAYNKTTVHFRHQDLFEIEALSKSLDVIVSNPPYVEQSRKKRLAPHVVNHEPHLALFVPDEDPLIYYRKLESLARKHPNALLKLYFEINEAFPQETRELFDRDIWNTRIEKDLSRLPRFLCVSKN
ncbi:MAG: peptide chain release factor N(5)-glutamine methyltransferase [Bacteroidota bacterium]